MHYWYVIKSADGMWYLCVTFDGERRPSEPAYKTHALPTGAGRADPGLLEARAYCRGRNGGWQNVHEDGLDAVAIMDRPRTQPKRDRAA